jgi:hypothetical protein
VKWSDMTPDQLFDRDIPEADQDDVLTMITELCSKHTQAGARENFSSEGLK